MNQSVTPYHHGDLRNCAIIAAAELIESIGSYDITIAQVAKRVASARPPFTAILRTRMPTHCSKGACPYWHHGIHH